MQKLYTLGMLFLLSSCATYQVAQSVKLVSYVRDPHTVNQSRLLHGQNCRSRLFGYDLGNYPSADLAVRDAQESASGRNPSASEARFINNFSLQETNFDALVFGQTCLVARGLGWQ